MAYVCGQKEKGAQGTEHYQLYIELSQKQRLGYMKNINRRAHWEFARGTQKQCIDYVTKEETRIEEPFECGKKEKTDIVGCKKDTISAKYIDRARKNYARFHNLEIDDVTESMITESSAGLAGWDEYRSGEESLDHEIPGFLNTSCDAGKVEEVLDETKTVKMSSCGPAEQDNDVSHQRVQKDLTSMCKPEDRVNNAEGANRHLKQNKPLTRKCTPEEIAVKKARALELLKQGAQVILKFSLGGINVEGKQTLRTFMLFSHVDTGQEGQTKSNRRFANTKSRKDAGAHALAYINKHIRSRTHTRPSSLKHTPFERSVKTWPISCLHATANVDGY